MKYKVIGWTYYEDNEIMSKSGTVSYAELNAIIDEIRENEYLFSGWHHQESWKGVVPVLNDCKKRCFSQRAWGSIMAMAYGYDGDYDYARFTFRQSISSEYLKFAEDSFNIYRYQPQLIENENFVVDVNEHIFDIAKNNNPFYLEDLFELRYIAEDDTITLRYGNDSLSFVVKDVERNSRHIGLKNSEDIIKGKNKIVLTHKPLSEKKTPKVPIKIIGSDALEMFEEALCDYNYDVIEELLNCFYFEHLSDVLPCENCVLSLTKFVKEYINNSYDSLAVIDILNFLDDFKLYEEIANKTFDKDQKIYTAFIDYYLEKNINMNSYILNFVDKIQINNKIPYESIDILFKAVCINPDNKGLRRKYYRAIKNTSYEGLSIMAGANLFKYLRANDRYFIELNNYKKYSYRRIREIVEYLTYPNNFVQSDSYPYNLPIIYESNEKVVIDGIKAYQKYINEHFDMNNMLLDMLYDGIDKVCFEMDCYLYGIEDAAKYIYTLDMITDLKYNFKEYAINKYSTDYENFKEELEKLY